MGHHSKGTATRLSIHARAGKGDQNVQSQICQRMEVQIVARNFRCELDFCLICSAPLVVLLSVVIILNYRTWVTQNKKISCVKFCHSSLVWRCNCLTSCRVRCLYWNKARTDRFRWANYKSPVCLQTRFFAHSRVATISNKHRNMRLIRASISVVCFERLAIKIWRKSDAFATIFGELKQAVSVAFSFSYSRFCHYHLNNGTVNCSMVLLYRSEIHVSKMQALFNVILFTLFCSVILASFIVISIK